MNHKYQIINCPSLLCRSLPTKSGTEIFFVIFFATFFISAAKIRQIFHNKNSIGIVVIARLVFLHSQPDPESLFTPFGERAFKASDAVEGIFDRTFGAFLFRKIAGILNEYFCHEVTEHNRSYGFVTLGADETTPEIKNSHFGFR